MNCFVSGDQNTSIIISYLMGTDLPVTKKRSETMSRLYAAISPIWKYLGNEPDRYVDTLLYDRIIDICGGFVSPFTLGLFIQHIYPALVEIAAMPSEKAVLSSVVQRLKTNHLFLSIIPKNEDKQSSRAYFASQGLIHSGRIEDIDSCVIELQCGDEIMRMMNDKDHRWHIGTTCKRSTLLHELTHLDCMLQDDFFYHPELRQTSSWVWTNHDECRVIDTENCALEARGAKRRLGHRVLSFTDQEFAKMSSTLKLGHALETGADATVKELCERHLVASEGSEERIHFSEFYYALLYLKDHPEKEEIIDKVVDGEFQLATRAHKNLGLIHLIMMLEQKNDGVNFIKKLLESIITNATIQQRFDVFPFIHGLQRLYN